MAEAARSQGALVGGLRRKALDLGLLYIPPPPEDPVLATEPLWPEPFVLVLPGGHALAGTTAVRLRQLGDAPLVFFRRALAPELFDTVLHICRDAGYLPRQLRQTTHFQSIVGLVAGGVGVGLVPASFQTLERPGVAFAEAPELAVPFGVHLVSRRDNPLSSVSVFAEELRSAIAARRPPSLRPALKLAQ